MPITLVFRANTIEVNEHVCVDRTKHVCDTDVHDGYQNNCFRASCHWPDSTGACQLSSMLTGGNQCLLEREAWRSSFVPNRPTLRRVAHRARE